MWYEVEVDLESTISVFIQGDSKEEVVEDVVSHNSYFVSSLDHVIENNYIGTVREPNVRKLTVKEVKSNPLLK